MRHTFRRENLEHIKERFQAGTGVVLAARRPVRGTVRVAAVLAAVFICCTATALAAVSMFSSLDGDDLGLCAVYQGNGVVAVQVENRSGKVLQFEPTLKLMRWSTGEEVVPLSGDVSFEDTTFKPHSSGTMTIDLSQAYDLEALEQPLTDDWYYFVLTNSGFAFGQDWTCSVEFAQAAVMLQEYPEPGQTDETAIQHMEESLRPYFEMVTYDLEERQDMNAEYVEAYTRLFAEFQGNIVPSVSPLLPGNQISSQFSYLSVDDPAPGTVLDESIPAEKQYALVGQHFSGVDANFKLLATQGEYALVLSADLPSSRYGDTGNMMPLFYLFTYEKSAISSQADCAFLYGRLVPFADLAQYLVYEDDRYVCYEVSGLIYSNLMEYAESYAKGNGDIPWNEQTRARIENIYSYYQENLSALISLS